MSEIINVKKELWALLKTFIVTIAIAFIVTNNQNYIYTWLNKFGLTNETFQKLFVSALVAIVFGIVRLLVFVIFELIVKNIKPLEIELTFKHNNMNVDEPLVFIPNGFEYSEKAVEVEIKFKPKGKLNIIIMKYLGIVINIYFNPKVIDIYYEDGWDGSDSSFNIAERAISVEILKQVSIRGRNFFDREHKLIETFLMKPIRVKNTETYLDYDFSLCKHGFLSKLFTNKIKLKYEILDVICKELD